MPAGVAGGLSEALIRYVAYTPRGPIEADGNRRRQRAVPTSGMGLSSVRGVAAVLVLLLLLLVPCFAQADGAASKEELGRLLQRYSDQHDEQKLGSLVYWSGVRQQERDGFFRSLRHDLTYRLLKVEFVPLEPNVKLEYVDGGVTFGPALPPAARMVATYAGQGNVKQFSTSYLVCVKDRRYYIDLAVPTH
jgi:hypothetical protein